jgi:adenine-specific DNA-methyltransferase
MLQAYDELPHEQSFRQPFRVLPSGDASALEAGYDLVYLDPPYLSLEQRYNRDDYWRRYHFLEGLAQYKYWHKRIDPRSDIRLLRQPKWMSGWSDKSRYSELLYSVVETHKESIVVLSYVADAYPDEIHIKKFFTKTFGSVVVHSREHSHALGAAPRRELLFIGQP